MKRLSSTDFNRSKQTLEEIGNDPYSFKELRGKFRNLRSARFGKHRIIYTIVEANKMPLQEARLKPLFAALSSS